VWSVFWQVMRQAIVGVVSGCIAKAQQGREKG
jgi:hypothetical protein